MNIMKIVYDMLESENPDLALSNLIEDKSLSTIEKVNIIKAIISQIIMSENDLGQLFFKGKRIKTFKPIFD